MGTKMDDSLITDVATAAVKPLPVPTIPDNPDAPQTLGETGLPPNVIAALLTAAREVERLDSPLDVLRLLIARRQAIYAELARLDIQIRILSTSMPEVARPLWTCKRCNHTWRSWTVAPPRICARCHTIGWNTEPRPRDRRARRPGDPPARSWKVSKPKPYKPRGRPPLPKAPSPIPWPTDHSPAPVDTTLSIDDTVITSSVARDDGLPPPPKASAFAPRALSRQLADLYTAESLDLLTGPVPVPAAPAPVDNPAADAYADDGLDDYDEMEVEDQDAEP